MIEIQSCKFRRTGARKIQQAIHDFRGPERLLDDFFHRAYYSHQMKKRKPDAEIFEQVLQEGNFRPEETLFLDDNQANVEGASKLGIKIVHVVNPDMIYDYFS